MKDAWRDQPTSARLEPVGLRIVEYTVVPLVPAGETSANIFFRRAWLKTKVCVWKISGGGIQLRREVVTFRFAFPANQLRLLLTLVEVVRNWAKIIKEFAVNRPAVVGVPHSGTYQARPFSLNGFLQCEPLSFRDNKAQPFIRRTV